VETTLTRLEDAAGELLQLTLKRPNKKTEKFVFNSHLNLQTFFVFFFLNRDLTLEIREKLKAKLTDEQDPAMILHLSITLLFYAINAGRFVHAPGKAVPALIKYLSKNLPNTINQRLHEMQGQLKFLNQTKTK
jgi:hypothetical protein